jgi:hypothetical protein
MGQSPASQVAAYRENSRLRQQKSREKKKAIQVGSVASDVTRDVGKAKQGSDTQGEASDRRVPWPVIEIPRSEGHFTVREGEIL